LESGKIVETGRDKNGSLELEYVDAKEVRPMSVWNRTSHAAGLHGSQLLSNLLPDRHFPFPKSLYAVEDTLRFVVGEKPDSTIVDFFAGSGTTAHAVMRLNKQDGGRRTSISITNNEVSEQEQKRLVMEGLRAGDGGWENLGICDYITKPRIKAAIEGKTPSGTPIAGDYKFTDEFPISIGLNENAEFFSLTYENALEVESGRLFSSIAPLLWLRAGSQGARIDGVENGWALSQKYGVLVDMDKISEFVAALGEGTGLNCVFINTGEDRIFETVSREIPTHIEVIRLYDAYIRNSEIEALTVTR
jgi:adenine-specific DNA-methyltransferase